MLVEVTPIFVESGIYLFAVGQIITMDKRYELVVSRRAGGSSLSAFLVPSVEAY